MPQLSAAAKRISASILPVKGKMEISDKSMARWVGDLNDLSASERSPLATELIAVALRLQREGGPPYANAVMQLCQLTSYLLSAPKPASTRAKSANKTPSKDAPKKPAAKVSKKK